MAGTAGGPDEDRIAARLEGAQANQRDQGGDDRHQEDDTDPERTCLGAVVDGIAGEDDEPEEATKDGGVSPDAK